MAGFEGVRKQPLVTEIRIKKALEQMKARGVDDDYCPRCHKFDWNVDLLEIPVSSAMSRPNYFFYGDAQGSQSTPASQWAAPDWQRTTGTFPVLSIVCKICGYAIFHNLNVLESK